MGCSRARFPGDGVSGCRTPCPSSGIVCSINDSNLPIGAVTILLVVLFLKAKTPQNEDRKLPFKTKLIYMDFGGTAILVAAVCCMLLALQWGGTKLPWRSSKIIGLLVGFGLLTCLFGYSQYRLGDRATIPRKILLQRSILMGCGYIFFINMSNYTVGSAQAFLCCKQRS